MKPKAGFLKRSMKPLGLLRDRHGPKRRAPMVSVGREGVPTAHPAGTKRVTRRRH